MATQIELSDATRAHLAKQVADFIGIGALSVREGDPIELAEAFPIWMLSASDAFASDPIPAITATGQWHHQLHLAGKPTAFARTHVFGPRGTDWQVSGVFQSSIAESIDNAITTADEASSGGEARLLLVPAWQIIALWLCGDASQADMCIIADAPRGDDIPLNRPLTMEEFFGVLRRLPIIEGRKL